MNDLALGKFDILMGDVGITHERQDLVDFSVAFQQDDVIIFRKNSDNHSNLFSFLLPLSVDVWIYIIISLILGYLSIQICNCQNFRIYFSDFGPFSHYQNQQNRSSEYFLFFMVQCCFTFWSRS